MWVRRGGDRKSKDALRTLKKLDDIASELGVSTQTLKEMLAIERKLTPEMKDLLNKGLFTESTASRVIAKLTPEEQEKLAISLPAFDRLTQRQVQTYIDQIQAKDNQIAGYELKAEQDKTKMRVTPVRLKVDFLFCLKNGHKIPKASILIFSQFEKHPLPIWYI